MISTRQTPDLLIKTRAELVMEEETHVTFGIVPHKLFGNELDEMAWQMLDHEFLLRGEGEHYFYYRQGMGVKIERGTGVDISEETLWLNGSLYSAIASINGLVPIHASAIVVDRSVFAFTGPAGAGKSTLVAALGLHGLPMFCDDTLVLDLADPDRIICLPGHKRLKLKPDAIALTGAKVQEQVSQTVDKFYARSISGDVNIALPLANLIFLEEGAQSRIEPILGAERLNRLQDDHQTSCLFAAAQKLDRVTGFAHLGRLARRLQMSRFVRPRDRSLFPQGVALIAEYVINHKD